MMFYTHLAFSFLAAMLGIRFFHPSGEILFVILVILFGALPDIDTDKSVVGRKFPLISKFIGFFFSHRGIFHTIYVPLLLFVLFSYYTGFSMAVAVALGYLSHLAGDALTIQGIRPFHPLHNLEIRGFLTTGSFAESILLIAIFIIDISLVVRWGL
ncbi:metal-dependent hydrolase [Candidatus Woesearchaeota archaeon]|nr:metal-dependent hydrolase [Candidatus Woesearchaeota archaeon]